MKKQRRLEKISTTLSLVGLALGFSVLGLLIVMKNQEGAPSIAGGILAILVGAAFMIATCVQWKRGDRIRGGLHAEEAPTAEIISEMRRSASAICSF